MGSTIIPPDFVVDKMRNANAVRLPRAALLKRIKGLPAAESNAFVADVLEDPPEILASMFITDLLYAVCLMRHGHPELMLERAGIDLTTQVGMLLPAELDVVVWWLRERAARASKTDGRK